MMLPVTAPLYGPTFQLRTERRIWLVSSSLCSSETIPSHGLVPFISLSVLAPTDCPHWRMCRVPALAFLFPPCVCVCECGGGGGGGGGVSKNNFGSSSPRLCPAAPLPCPAAPFPPLRHAVQNIFEKKTRRETHEQKPHCCQELRKKKFTRVRVRA